MLPIERGPDRFVLELGASSLEVDPTRGARVVAFSHAGRNVLRPVASDNGFLNGGSTLWTSPQADWSWPPLTAHDAAAYDAAVEGDAIVASGPAAELAGSRVSLSKRFAPAPEAGAIHIDYTLHNAGDAPVTLAAWEVSRHPTGGLTFWAGTTSHGELAPRQIGEHLWLAYADAWSGSPGKLFADASAGWLAHAQDGLLVVRSWQDVPPEQQAPGEAEVEVYLAADYVELEVQGPHTEIAPGGASAFRVRWQVLPLDDATDVTAGSEALLEQVHRALR